MEDYLDQLRRLNSQRHELISKMKDEIVEKLGVSWHQVSVQSNTVTITFSERAKHLKYAKQAGRLYQPHDNA